MDVIITLSRILTDIHCSDYRILRSICVLTSKAIAEDKGCHKWYQRRSFLGYYLIHSFVHSGGVTRSLGEATADGVAVTGLDGRATSASAYSYGDHYNQLGIYINYLGFSGGNHSELLIFCSLYFLLYALNGKRRCLCKLHSIGIEVVNGVEVSVDLCCRPGVPV